MAGASNVRSRFRRSSECAGHNVSERRASLEKDIAQADPTAISEKADTAGETSEEYLQSLCRGSGDKVNEMLQAASPSFSEWSIL